METGIQGVETGIQVMETGIQRAEIGIQREESEIQGVNGLPYVFRYVNQIGCWDDISVAKFVDLLL